MGLGDSFGMRNRKHEVTVIYSFESTTVIIVLMAVFGFIAGRFCSRDR
jgi:hypothetical protein